MRIHHTIPAPIDRPDPIAWAKMMGVGRKYNRFDRTYQDWPIVQAEYQKQKAA